jgi:hypothetical protein
MRPRYAHVRTACPIAHHASRARPRLIARVRFISHRRTSARVEPGGVHNRVRLLPRPRGLGKSWPRYQPRSVVREKKLPTGRADQGSFLALLRAPVAIDHPSLIHATRPACLSLSLAGPQVLYYQHATGKVARKTTREQCFLPHDYYPCHVHAACLV